MSCIFCRIVAGDIPAAKVHEDEHLVAFKLECEYSVGIFKT
jgi:diadenosine tetraphosphate (Ap4A) HIT family hydrolase